MSVGNLSSAAFGVEKYLGTASPSNNYGIKGMHANTFDDRAARDATSFASHSAATNTSMGSMTAWKARNPGHVVGQGAWNKGWNVSFDNPSSTPRPAVQ